VNVAGLSVQQAEQAVNSESVLRGVYRTPCITLKHEAGSDKQD